MIKIKHNIAFRFGCIDYGDFKFLLNSTQTNMLHHIVWTEIDFRFVCIDLHVG